MSQLSSHLVDTYPTGLHNDQTLIRVVLVSDHAIVREGIRMILETDVRIDVVGEAETVNDALPLIDELYPDVILLDVAVRSESPLNQLDRITSACGSARILILTGADDEDLTKRVIVSGAHGLVLKTVASAILLTAVKKVHQGEAWFDRSVTSRMLGAGKQDRDEKNERRKIKTLTPRERAIAKLIAEGLVNKDIARRLAIAEKTVRNHSTVIYSKLDLTNRLELAVYAATNALE